MMTYKFYQFLLLFSYILGAKGDIGGDTGFPPMSFWGYFSTTFFPKRHERLCTTAQRGSGQALQI